MIPAPVVLMGRRQVPPVAHWVEKVGRTWYHAVLADVGSGKVAARTIHRDRLVSPWRLLRPVQPEAAITGTFFAPQNGTPVADVLVDGRLVAQGNRGTALAVGDDGRVRIVDRPFLRRVDWSGYRWGLRGAVRLLRDGKLVANPRAQGFRDPHIWCRAARSGVGITRGGKVLLVATRSNVSLSEFANALRKLGAVDAVSLDGGGSTCLYYEGTMVVPTSRKLSNMFAIGGFR